MEIRLCAEEIKEACRLYILKRGLRPKETLHGDLVVDIDADDSFVVESDIIFVLEVEGLCTSDNITLVQNQ